MTKLDETTEALHRLRKTRKTTTAVRYVVNFASFTLTAKNCDCSLLRGSARPKLALTTEKMIEVLASGIKIL